ncbi:unnamed protein product, partial [Medioppia subpectinata]
MCDLDFDDEEFVEPEGEEKHLKGALIALLVIGIICSLIILSINLKALRFLWIESVKRCLNTYHRHEFIYKHQNESLVLFDANTNNITSILVHSYITRQFDTQRNIIHLQQLIEDQNKISIQWAEWSPVGNALSISPKESMMWWSRDGTSILYTTIDNSGVGDNTIVFYGSLHNESDSNSLKYQIIPPKGLLNKDFYVTFVNWINEERVTVVWTPRNQNNSIVSTCDKSDDWMCKE